MPLIIDCYNLLHASKPAMFAALDERGLCTSLARSAWRDGGITVVCDGQPKPLGLLESPVPQVTLIYSGSHRTADAVIIDHIATSSAPRRLVVVSSDHEIRQAARRRRAKSWSSEYFLGRLAADLGQTGLAPPPGQDKPAAEHLPPSEVSRWLDEFGFSREADAREPNPKPGPEDIQDDDPWPPW